MIEPLEWDTKILGFPVARMNHRVITRSVLKSTLAELKADGIRCVYWLSDPEDPASQEAAALCGGILADEKITFSQPLPTEPINVQNHVESFDNVNAVSQLEAMALSIGHESRFYLDSHMPRDAYKKIYRAWIANSVNRSVADNVLVTKNGRAVTGFVSVINKGDYGSIALIAVDEGQRGKGIGSVLVQAALQWCQAQGLDRCEVATQKSNTVACALYEKMGFTLKSIESFYHFWL